MSGKLSCPVLRGGWGGNTLSLPDQVAALPEMPERLMFYLGRMITGQIGKGQDYGHPLTHNSKDHLYSVETT
jgi:hypothetical protein